MIFLTPTIPRSSPVTPLVIQLHDLSVSKSIKQKIMKIKIKRNSKPKVAQITQNERKSPQEKTEPILCWSAIHRFGPSLKCG